MLLRMPVFFVQISSAVPFLPLFPFLTSYVVFSPLTIDKTYEENDIKMSLEEYSWPSVQSIA